MNFFRNDSAREGGVRWRFSVSLMPSPPYCAAAPSGFCVGGGCKLKKKEKPEEVSKLLDKIGTIKRYENKKKKNKKKKIKKKKNKKKRTCNNKRIK